MSIDPLAGVAAVFVAAIVGKIVGAVISQEFVGWLRLFTRWLVRRAAMRLPAEVAERWEEEIQAHLLEYSDRPLSGMVHAVDAWRSIRKLPAKTRSSEAQIEVADEL